MIEPLQTVLIGASLLLALVTGAYVAVNRSPDKVLIALLALIEVGLVAQLVIGLAQVFGDGPDLGATFVGYLLTAVVALPLGLGWSLGEQSRGSTAVLLVALVTTAFLVLRLEQIRAAAV